MVPGVLAQAPPNLERVAEAVGDEQADLRAAALEHRIRRDRRAVDEQCRRTEQFLDGATDPGRGRGDRVEGALRRIGRHRGHLEHADVALRVGEHEVGERATDVDADAPGGRHAGAHAAAFARLRRGAADERGAPCASAGFDGVADGVRRWRIARAADSAGTRSLIFPAAAITARGTRRFHDASIR